MEFIDLKTQLQNIRPQIDQAIQKVLDHGHFIMGQEIGLFEKNLSDFTGVSQVISCSDGTDALTLSLLALELQRDEVVFVPSFTFISTAEVVALRGAIPFFVDIDPKTYTLCPESLERSIQDAKKQGLKIKGIISVDLFGQPADHDRINDMARQHDLWVIIDAAQSCGARYKDKSTVSYGTVATTSFFPAKPLGCYGDGGAIFTQDSALADRLRSVRLHGQGKIRYTTDHLGLTGRLDTMQAAILIEKLKIFPQEIQRRNQVASYYSEALKDLVEVPFISSKNISVWAQYTIKLKNRDDLKEHLTAQDIPAVVYYPYPLHQQIPYKHFPCDPLGLKSTEMCAKNVLSLPMHPYLTPEIQDNIIHAIRTFG